jgi:hypothetical protein
MLAKNAETECNEKLELVKADGSKITVDLKVLRGSCPATAAPCGENELIDLNFASDKACTCQPLHPHHGVLYELSKADADKVDFTMMKDNMITLREWKNAENKYDWDLPADHTWSKCLAPVDIDNTGSTFDDGRYRQVSYKAVKADCLDTLVRTSTNP